MNATSVISRFLSPFLILSYLVVLAAGASHRGLHVSPPASSASHEVFASSIDLSHDTSSEGARESGGSNASHDESSCSLCLIAGAYALPGVNWAPVTTSLESAHEPSPGALSPIRIAVRLPQLRAPPLA